MAIRPRLFLIADDGSVVGSAVHNRLAWLLGLESWEFCRPLQRISTVDARTVPILPVDPEVLRAMRRSVAFC